jgi:hypothetical protein
MMKKLMNWANRALKKMTVRDAGMLKVLLLLIGMILGASFPLFVNYYLYFFITVIVVLWVILGWKFYRK